MRKILSLMAGVLSVGTAWASDLPCTNEYKKLGVATTIMASSDLNEAKIKEAQSLIDEWQPKYQACVEEYGKAHGDNARADLEVKLAAENAPSAAH